MSLLAGLEVNGKLMQDTGRPATSKQINKNVDLSLLNGLEVNGTVIGGEVLPEPQQIDPVIAQEPDLDQQATTQAITEQPAIGEEESTFLDKALGVGETALSMTTGAIAKPVSGIIGLGRAAIGGSLEDVGETIDLTQEFLTYEPKTKEGVEVQSSVGEFLEPVGTAIQESGEFLGDISREGTGSYIAGGLAQSVPELALELIGFKGGGKLFAPKRVGEISVTPKEALSQAAPEIKDIKSKASSLYKEISDAGVNVSKSDYQNLGVSLNNIARRSGFDESLTPKSKAFLDRVTKDFGKAEIKLTDIDQLRKVAQEVAGSIDNRTDAVIGVKMIERIDDFIEKQAPTIAKKHGTDVASKYKEARSLISRARKSELIDEAFTRAEVGASGFERGIANEMRSILKNKKKRRGFTSDEIKAMKDIANSGGSLQKIYARLGNLGIGEGAQRTGLLGLLGAFGAASVAGPAGVFAPVALGTMAGKKAAKMAENNVNFARDLVRSGKNGVDVTKAYLKHVPKKMQKKEDLASLLIDPTVDISKVKDFASKIKANKELVAEANFIADKVRAGQLTGATIGEAVASQQTNMDNNQQ